MNTTTKLSLNELKPGETAVVNSIENGVEFRNKVNAMGIRPGVKIKLISSQILKGPVMIQVNTTKLAIGHGMAKKIYIDKVNQ